MKPLFSSSWLAAVLLEVLLVEQTLVSRVVRAGQEVFVCDMRANNPDNTLNWPTTAGCVYNTTTGLCPAASCSPCSLLGFSCDASKTITSLFGNLISFISRSLYILLLFLIL